MWHGGGDLDVYLDSEEFIENVNSLISTKFKYNLLVQVLHKVFPEFLIEQMRMKAYYKCLGQFWKEMSHIFLCLSDSYDNHKNFNDKMEDKGFITELYVWATIPF